MKYEVYKDSAGEWRWRAVADNGEIVASGEGYVRRIDAIETLRHLANDDDLEIVIEDE